ncbi:MAG: hypothetical protein ACOC45_04175, partial [Alkalispirochaetaceae bacterium]
MLSVLCTFFGHFIHPVHWFMPFVYRSECFCQVLVTGVVEELQGETERAVRGGAGPPRPTLVAQGGMS